MINRHVIPVEGGWQVTKEHAQRPSATASTQAEAIANARQIVANNGGGEIVIHDSDGNQRTTRAIPASDDVESGNQLTNHSEHQPATKGHHMNPLDGNKNHPATRHGHHAARHATERNSLHLDLPLIGSVTLPPADQLAYLAGITALVAVGILDWPVAALLGAGHLLASTRNNKILTDFGKALEEA